MHENVQPVPQGDLVQVSETRLARFTVPIQHSLEITSVHKLLHQGQWLLVLYLYMDGTFA